MNAAQVLDHFNRVCDAPDAIPRLRRFILDLAIRGKLVEQGSDDEPASELLKRIQAKSRTGAIKRKRDPNKNGPITEDEIPFSVSSNITFARLATIARIEKGSTGIQKAKPGNYPLVTLAEDRATSAEYQFDAAAAIVPLISSTGHGHASLKRMHYQEGKFALGNILCAVIPFAPELVSARFIYEYLWAYKEALLVERMIGTANVSLTIGKIGEAPVPIISPHSQERLHELMVLCDRLETAQIERQSRRNKLAAASLHRLNNSANANKFREHARFHLRHLPRLTTRSEHLKQLRQTICNLAVRGKLVLQDPNDEPAATLLLKIKKERCSTTGTSSLSLLNRNTSITEPTEFHYDIPESWEWCELQEISVFINGKAHERFVTDKPGFVLVNSRFVSNSGEIVKYTTERLSPLTNGDIAIVMSDVPDGRALARCFVVDADEKYTLNQRIGCIRTSMYLCENYLAMVLDRNKYFLQYDDGKKQTNLKKIQIVSCPVPLPPLAEQRRIMAKVDELTILCDRLEAQLTKTQTESHRLLEAVLHEALNACG